MKLWSNKTPDERKKLKTKASMIIGAVAAGLIISNIGLGISKDYEFALNETESLPNWAFMINKHELTPKRGDYFVFIPPKNPYYPAGFRFTKEIAGVPGDVVTIDVDRKFYVNGKYVGTAKTHSKNGQVAIESDPGVIPADSYFVVTPHPDSLDSRYKMIGLIPKSRLIGHAYPLM